MGDGIDSYGKWCNVGLHKLSANLRVAQATLAGTMSRIKAQETSVGIDTLEALGAFFKLEPYELLIPGLQAKEITVILNMRGMSEEKQGDIVKISSALTQPADNTHGTQ